MQTRAERGYSFLTGLTDFSSSVWRNSEKCPNETLILFDISQTASTISERVSLSLTAHYQSYLGIKWHFLLISNRRSAFVFTKT